MICKLLDSVTDFKEFLSVDELNKEITSMVDSNNIINLGKSENGNSIISVKIGKGKENALIFGFPHPNEPVGSLTCIELVKILLNNEKLRNRYTWYIIPCVDPDGAKLNEGWFKGKFTIKKYAYNFFRPPGKYQIDWSFPVKYKDYEFLNPTKETKILIKLINKIKPSLIYPLHNAGFGGAYFYINRKMPTNYYDKIIDLCKKLSIHIDYGESEAVFMKELKKPFYLSPSFEEMYDYFEKSGINPKEMFENGTNSIDYAKKLNQNVFGMIGEIPYIYDPKISNKKKTSIPRRIIFQEKYKERIEVIEFIRKNMNNKFINKKSIFFHQFENVMEQKKATILLQEMLSKKEYDKLATVSEKFGSLVISRFFMLLLLGQFRRLLLDSNRNNQTKQIVKKIEKKIDNILTYVEKESNYKTLPIKKLVQLQLGLLLISLEYL